MHHPAALHAPCLLLATDPWMAVADLPVEQIGNLSATAMLGWYAWYTASRTVPELLRAFREELDHHRAQADKQQSLFAGQLAEQRALQHADTLLLLDALHDLSLRCHSHASPASTSLPANPPPRT